MTKRMLIMLGAVLLLIVALGLGFYLHIQKLIASAPKPGPQTVTSIKAELLEWQPQISAIGSLSPTKGVDLSSEIAGLVRSVNFRSGDEVQAGQLLIQLNADSDNAAWRSASAAAELAEPCEESDEDDDFVVESEDDTDEEIAVERGAVPAAGVLGAGVLGGDAKFWEHVGIDPVRVMASGGTFYTLRCYFDDKPVFLGRNGRISVFPSERTLARYLADEHDHDLADLSTYDDIRTAATDGSLRVDVTEDNIYVLTGLVDDIAAGPDAIDHDQLALAVEFVRDVGDYSEDDTVETLLASDTALGELVDYALNPDSGERPSGPFNKAVAEWEQLERFVESRLRRE